jgi:arylsulfatase A-like enzyme
MMAETSTIEKQHPKPNVLFILADQLGAVYTGCYGHPQVKTPNLDRLAEESVLFDNAYTAAPLCTPFRGTLFTGRYPLQTGIWRNSYRLPGSEDTLADCFNRAGYNTSYAGKWHLAGPPRKIWVPPMERGGFHDFVGWDCGHVRHIDQKYFDGSSSGEEERVMEGHETDRLTEIACGRLRSLALEPNPFFAFVSYQAPHPFCDPPAEYLDLYRGRELCFRETVDHDARFKGYGRGSPEMAVTEWTERYFGEITHLDAAVGRLLAELDALGLRDNTIVVFTSDHGDMGGCRGRFEKSVPYEEATRIPLLVRLPGGAQARRVDPLFSSIDFLPTLLGLCGLPPAGATEGVNYAPLMAGEAASPRRQHLVMQLEDWSCIRSGDAKLTLDPEGMEPRELYRLGDDPFEQANLVADPNERDTVRQLRSAYAAWLQDVHSRVGDTAEASAPSPGLRG